MNLNSTWSALEESYNRFNGISFEGSLNAIAELNLPSDWFIWLVAVMFFGDEPISSGEFMCALPYGWQAALEERFASAARQGYLTGDGAGGYRLAASTHPRGGRGAPVELPQPNRRRRARRARADLEIHHLA